MTVVKIMVAALFAVALSLGAGVARDFTPIENERLKATVGAYEAALRTGDFLAVQSVIPPKIIARLASLAGVSVKELTQGIAAKMAEAMHAVNLDSFGMDISKAEHRSTSSGRPYVLIPTEVIIATERTGRIAVASHTLALLNGHDWFLVRVSEAHLIEMLLEAYPDFTGIEFPRGSVKALE